MAIIQEQIGADVGRFVERMGRRFERDGMPRTAGRLFALLLLTPGTLSLEQLAERLAVSKGNVSASARLLAQFGLVERHSPPGERKDYYGVGDDVCVRILERQLDILEDAQGLLTGLDEVAHAQGPEVSERVSDLLTAQAELIEATRQRLSSWRSRTAARNGRMPRRRPETD
jgi:DNA-binding transcriptional regulator GbsR (MarR family)